MVNQRAYSGSALRKSRLILVIYCSSVCAFRSSISLTFCLFLRERDLYTILIRGSPELARGDRKPTDSITWRYLVAFFGADFVLTCAWGWSVCVEWVVTATDCKDLLLIRSGRGAANTSYAQSFNVVPNLTSFEGSCNLIRLRPTTRGCLTGGYLWVLLNWLSFLFLVTTWDWARMPFSSIVSSRIEAVEGRYSVSLYSFFSWTFGAIFTAFFFVSALFLT